MNSARTSDDVPTSFEQKTVSSTPSASFFFVRISSKSFLPNDVSALSDALTSTDVKQEYLEITVTVGTSRAQIKTTFARRHIPTKRVKATDGAWVIRNRNYISPTAILKWFSLLSVVDGLGSLSHAR